MDMGQNEANINDGVHAIIHVVDMLVTDGLLLTATLSGYKIWGKCRRSIFSESQCVCDGWVLLFFKIAFDHRISLYLYVSKLPLTTSFLTI